MKIYRPLWNEGALLSPQQFQQQAEWESFRSAGASALALAFPWGVEKIEFNDSLLSSGLIQITQLRLWLEDGSLIDAQRSDLPPPPRELDTRQLAGRDAITVVIALPHMQPGMINVEQEGVSPDRPLRYREEWVMLQDAFGSEEESMAVARFNFTIRFAHESNDSWKVCPVARLIRDGHNAWRLDPSFIPPVASFAASPALRERLVLLNRQLRSRRQRLMTMRRESNERLADFAVADVSLFWLLNALNSHARVLTEYERFPSRPPEQVWIELARLAGSMLTFSLDHDLDAIPGYDHGEPARTFPPLFDLITGLLEASLPSRVIALEMSRPDGQTWKANLHDIRLAWRKAPLQARFFGSLRAGEALWDRIAEVLRQPSPNPTVLTCYHRVIALGFQGLYSLKAVSQSQRDEVVKALSERVSPPVADLSLVVHRMGKHRWSLMRSVWFWITLAVVLTGIIWWGGHLWLQALLSAHIPEQLG